MLVLTLFLAFPTSDPSIDGQHTGKWGFDTFTHFRSTIDSPDLYASPVSTSSFIITYTFLNSVEAIMSNRYPPYTDKKLKLMKRILAPSMPPRVGDSPSILSRILAIFRSVLWVSAAAGLGYSLLFRVLRSGH